MGKNLIQQRRGRGTSTFRAHGFHGAGDVRIPLGEHDAIVVDLIASSFHTAPLMKVKYGENEEGLLIAPEGVRVGQAVRIGTGAIETGNTLTLKDLPIGALVCNIEGTPGDGGKFARGSGTMGRVTEKQGDTITILLPSKKKRDFNGACRATLGVAAGGGRLEKPLMKAGIKFHKMKSKNRYWPLVSGASMNAVAHPFGGKRSSRKGRPTIAPKNAPPGRMVGMIRPRKTGRARGTRVRKS
jgi:large subunit ribosomal protein L2